jgi:hypothetical protein
MQLTTLWQLLQSEVEKGKVLWTAGQLAQQRVIGWSQMVILWPVIVHLSLKLNQTVTAWPVIVHLSLTFSQTVTAWPVSLLGTSVEDCCDKFSIVQCSVIWCTTL